MGNRGFGQDEKSLLWGGFLLLAASAGMAVVAVAGTGSAALRFAAALYGAGAGVLLLLLRSQRLVAARAARMLFDSVKGHVEEDPETSSLEAAAMAVSEFLDRHTGAGAGGRSAVSEDSLREEIRALTEAHQDLVTHHRITKRMFQSLRHDEVLDTLILGIRNGLGFSDTILGIRNPGGIIFFQGDPSLSEGEPVSIPCWDDNSLLVRTLWNGTPLKVSSLGEHMHTVEDRRVLGEGPSVLVPLYRKRTRKCSELKNCSNTDCSAYGVEGPRCWLVGAPRLAGPDPEALERQKKLCARCEMFALPAIVVARESNGSRVIGPEATAAIVSLVDEALLALDIAEMYENTRIMSVTDGLTGLTNHRDFYSILRKELERARRYSHSVSLLMIDVDDFKKFNDVHGHMAGDLALKTIAGLLRQCVRATDIVARYGGEEFGIILPESSPVGSLMLAERIKTEVAAHVFIMDGREEVHLTVSIGIYTSERGDDSEDLMVGYADEAAYLAKNSGKNQVVVKAHA